MTVFAEQSADITSAFTDLNFRAAVYAVIGKAAPAPILDTDVAGVTYLDASGKNIQSLEGLEYFTSLTGLDCQDNQLTELPTLPTSLKEFMCYDNQLTELPELPAGLTFLGCSGNQLTELDVTGLSLEFLDCRYNCIKNEATVVGFTGTWARDEHDWWNPYYFTPQRIPPVYDFSLTPSKWLVGVGDEISMSAAFLEPVNSNVAVLTYAFGRNMFDYEGFTPAEGVTVLNSAIFDANEQDKVTVKITVMKEDYGIKNLGEILLRAGDESNFMGKTVTLDAEYVVRDADTNKEIKTASATASVMEGVPGDTNGDGKVTLIDLSNIIEWLGINDSNYPEWNAKYKFFDFNVNGEIDIADIAFVAKLII